MICTESKREIRFRQQLPACPPPRGTWNPLYQLYHSGWDAHSNVAGNVTKQAKAVDQASSALVQDLKRLGMLEDTLVVWGGEFGRTPMVEASAALNPGGGRDHHPSLYHVDGRGGTKPGITLGKTDELGFHVTEDPVLRS